MISSSPLGVDPVWSFPEEMLAVSLTSDSLSRAIAALALINSVRSATGSAFRNSESTCSSSGSAGVGSGF